MATQAVFTLGGAKLLKFEIGFKKPQAAPKMLKFEIGFKKPQVAPKMLPAGGIMIPPAGIMVPLAGIMIPPAEIRWSVGKTVVFDEKSIVF